MQRRTRSLIILALAVTVPAWADDATDPPATATATFSMYCYWTGEATVGRVDGVEASRIGHWGGDEVVQVDYDPRRTSLGELVRTLEAQRSFDAVIVSRPAERSEVATALDGKRIEVHRGEARFIEPKHSLRVAHPELLDLGLTESQAIALNTWSYFGGPMPDVLTAEQKRRLAKKP